MANVSEIYKKKTHIEHILDIPDTYIGSIEKNIETLYVLNDDNKFIKKEINYIPGLHRIFEEILLNAFDQTVRKDMNVTKIKVDIDEETGRITVFNNGKGIPVQMHKEYNMWIPAMIFGELLTSSNYDKNAKRITGGKNGYGGKLANIFSKEFIVETVDQESEKKFYMKFENNMSIKNKPKITSYKNSSYTKISFIPDFERFDIKGFNKDMIDYMKKRVYDISACSNNNVSVYYNNFKIPFKSFDKYVNLYLNNDRKIIHEVVNDRWEVSAFVSDNHFESVSFVNGLSTIGGTHVEYVANGLTRELAKIIKKKNKTIKNFYIKDKLFIFVKAFIENPSFDSQSKQILKTSVNKFGSKCVLSEKFIKDFLKTGIIDEVIATANFKEERSLKKTDGKKQKRLIGIPKLDDANYAGTKFSNKCKLILTEGDSAKAFAISGLSKIGRDFYGIFPLKGKMLNVKCATKQQLLNNEELNNLKQILGLKQGHVYKSLSETRYGGIVSLVDQDHDGSHIKGLLFNWLHTFWPSLLKLGFSMSLSTPIIKAFKGNQVISFYTQTEYEQWKINNINGWRIKYYKGLGTSDKKEAQESFTDFEEKLIHYDWDQKSDDSLNLAFGKDNSDLRKNWLMYYNKDNIITQAQKNVSFTDFINKELIHFSTDDNKRSIPSIVDGLKPSQRKVLYCALMRNKSNKNEIKVAQFAGYVGQHSDYHHGEASLISTIVNMAQNYVGSNNINTLLPNGMFGTRIMGGKDHASERYIFTNINNITTQIFNPNDTPLLQSIESDGQFVEPYWFIPVVPMILVNGTSGIGTGFSTDVFPHNLDDIIQVIKDKLNNINPKKIIPWFRGFKGIIDEIDDCDGKFLSRGTYNIDYDNFIVEINELPIGIWTENYKNFLEKSVYNKNASANEQKKQFLLDYDNYCTDSKILFKLKFDKNIFTKFIKYGTEKFESELKLSKILSMNNMHLYDKNYNIIKYDNANHILDDFFNIRYEFYEKRKIYMLQNLKDKIKILKNKVKFIKYVNEQKIKVLNITDFDLNKQLEDFEFNKIAINDNDEPSYDYLITMPIRILTLEQADKLTQQYNQLKDEYKLLKNKTIKDLWITDLDIIQNLNSLYNSNLQKEIDEEIKIKSDDKKKRKQKQKQK